MIKKDLVTLTVIVCAIYHMPQTVFLVGAFAFASDFQTQSQRLWKSCRLWVGAHSSRGMPRYQRTRIPRPPDRHRWWWSCGGAHSLVRERLLLSDFCAETVVNPKQHSIFSALRAVLPWKWIRRWTSGWSPLPTKWSAARSVSKITARGKALLKSTTADNTRFPSFRRPAKCLRKQLSWSAWVWGIVLFCSFFPERSVK